MTERLIQIANMVKECDCAADIGTDHAYLPVYLIEQGICNRVIASDINKGPLLNARQTIEEKAMQEIIELRLGGGFSPYKKDEADVYIIAGMGGHLIAEILKQKPLVAQSGAQLILQPMQHPEILRKFLLDNGYRIECEKFVAEKDKLYQIINAKFTNEVTVYDDFQLIYGVKPLKDEIYYLFLQSKLNQIEHILKHLSVDKHKTKYEQIKTEQAKLKELLSGY